MPTVLLVDDSATDRQIVGAMLQKNHLAVRFAENGKGALKQLRSQQPDIVLTDMQMPEMDGLQLVRAIREEFSHIPVILMTGMGSETLAAQALQAGAASYVPKSKINELLVDSINHVLQLGQADSDFQRLIDHATVTDFHFKLENDVTLIPPLVTLVQQMVGGLGQSDAAVILQIGVAFEQALINAMCCGNLELPPEDCVGSWEAVSQLASDKAVSSPDLAKRSCLVRAIVTRQELKVTVRDEGNGFDVESNLAISMEDNDLSGRGLVLMWGLMDKVVFNKTGNELTMTKSLTHIGGAEAEPAKVETDSAATAPHAAHLPTPAKSLDKLGELIALDGGESVVMREPRLTIGRSRSCDVVLPFSDVSGQHCLLYMYCGWWYVKDLKSSNGVRVNRVLVDQRRVPPGSVLSIGTHRFEVQYNPSDLGAVGITPPVDPF